MFGYLDPGSGSMIVQGLVAGAAGAAVVGKLGWKRLTSPLRRRDGAPETTSQPVDETTE